MSLQYENVKFASRLHQYTQAKYVHKRTDVGKWEVVVGKLFLGEIEPIRYFLIIHFKYLLIHHANTESLITTLRRDFLTADVDDLLKTEYVPIDIRLSNCSSYELEEWLKRTVLSSLLALPNTPATVIEKWTKQPVAGWSVQSILQEFMRQRERRFFFHFDEIDDITAIKPAVPPHTGQNEAEVVRYYTFCSALLPILRIGSFVYCSGRSAILYAIGRGWFSNIPTVANVKLSK